MLLGKELDKDAIGQLVGRLCSNSEECTQVRSKGCLASLPWQTASGRNPHSNGTAQHYSYPHSWVSALTMLHVT